jgi:probable LLM family oxidoreductase
MDRHVEIGIDSFAVVTPASAGGKPPVGRMADLLEEIEIADAVGLDVFGVGEHHRTEFLDSAPTVILGAAAARTRSIRLTSAVTVLSAADPVRIFQEFATIDLISQGRAEIVVGRGSFTEAYPLFGFALGDYDALFTEKLDLLLKLRDEDNIHWRGRFRAPLTGQAIAPRPLQSRLPIWLGVGGTPQSFARAGRLGLPLMVAIIGGDPAQFRPLVDLYRQSGITAGHAREVLKVGLHMIGFPGDSTDQAANDFYPGYARIMTEVGGERGWPPMTRNRFDAMLVPRTALLVGDASTVAEKMLYADAALGGVDRITFQMGAAGVAPARMRRAIEVLGEIVAPIVRAAKARAPRGSTD